MPEARARRAGGTGGTASRRRPPTPPPGPETAPPAPEHGSGPICSVAFCPICLAVSAVGDIKPEMVEHLLLAGREMLLAIRTVIDQRLETMEEATKSSIQRISIE